MEQLSLAVTHLKGSVKGQLELIKKLEQQLQALESKTGGAEAFLVVPKTEQDLKDICKFPDCVKKLHFVDSLPNCEK